MAEDASKVAPHVYRVLFENERFRFLEVEMQPGDRTEMHSHPDYFINTGPLIAWPHSRFAADEAASPTGTFGACAETLGTDMAIGSSSGLTEKPKRGPVRKPASSHSHELAEPTVSVEPVSRPTGGIG